MLASTTKPFTATMIMQLVERGRLSLETRLARFYPRLPNARRITVRMLLTHTSGLEDYVDGPAFERGAEDPRHRWTRAEVLRGVRQAHFVPGEHYEYSNTNYVVLGGILERVGGKGVESAFRDGIATRAGLPLSSFTSAPTAGAAGTDAYGPLWTDGGLVSTAIDVARFGDALFLGRIVRPSTLRTMTTLDRFGGGLGLYPSKAGAFTWIGHSGSYGGFESELWHERTRGVTIAVTVNADDASGEIWDAVAEAYDENAPTRGC